MLTIKYVWLVALIAGFTGAGVQYVLMPTPETVPAPETVKTIECQEKNMLKHEPIIESPSRGF